MFIIISFMTMISIFMYFITHPLLMGLMILMQTLLTCLMSGMLIKTYWFSYILFLTFLGGLLVLFIYVTSMASNEMFYKMFNTKSLFIMTIMFMFIMIMNFNWTNFLFNEEMNEMINNFMFFNNENKLDLSKLYNSQTFILTIILIIYLFITLIAIVKITNIFYGPLRSNF